MQNRAAVFQLNFSKKTSFCASISRTNAKRQTVGWNFITTQSCNRNHILTDLGQNITTPPRWTQSFNSSYQEEGRTHNREFAAMLEDEYNLSFISLSAHIQPTEFYQLLLLSSSSVFQSAAVVGGRITIPNLHKALLVVRKPKRPLHPNLNKQFLNQKTIMFVIPKCFLRLQYYGHYKSSPTFIWT